MGFRLAFRTTQNIISVKDDFATTTGGIAPTITYFKSQQRSSGLLLPELAWSLTKNLTENGVKPWAAFGVTFNQNYNKYETYADPAVGVTVASSTKSVVPRFDLGLGGFTFIKKESGFSASVDMDYRLTITAYDNEYNYTDANSRRQIGTLKGTNTNGALAEASGSSHRIRPSLAGQWSGGTLALRSRLVLPVTITPLKYDAMAIQLVDSVPVTNGNLVKDGTSSQTTTVNFAPTVELAAQWRIVPRLTLNAGGLITISNLQSSTEKGSIYTNGSQDDNSSFKTVTYTRGTTANALTAGFSFRPTDNLTFEASSGIGSSNNVSVFDPSGFVNFTSILASLRF
jgi:hypothetical protein